MKKNKKLTLFLLISVIGLWVLVFYRLYQSFFSEQQMEVVASKPTVVKIKVKDAEQFVLKANYSDPFLGNQFNRALVQANVPKKNVQPKAETKPEVVIDWSFISYLGLIKNQQNQKKVALVSLSGKEYMVSEGDQLQEITFLKNYKDSLQVSYKGKTAYLRKK